MKKTLSILLASALAMTSVSAQAGVYFGLRGGYNNIEVENTSADIEEGEGDWLASGYIGFRASDFFRFDVEGMFNPERSFEGGALKTTSHTVMGNLYLQPDVRSIVVPYVVGGAGVAFHKVKAAGQKSENSESFAWNAGIGLEYEVSEKLFFDVSGRYVDMGDAKTFDKNTDLEMRGMYWSAGLRFEY